MLESRLSRQKLGAVARYPRYPSISVPDFGFKRPLHRTHREDRFVIIGCFDCPVTGNRATFINAVDLVSFHLITLSEAKNNA
jgi:hypothetical protein